LRNLPPYPVLEIELQFYIVTPNQSLPDLLREWSEPWRDHERSRALFIRTAARCIRTAGPRWRTTSLRREYDSRASRGAVLRSNG